MDGRLCENKQHGDTVPEKARDMFLCSLQINITKARQMPFSTAGYVCSTQTRVIFNPAVGVDARCWVPSQYVESFLLPGRRMETRKPMEEVIHRSTLVPAKKWDKN